MGPGPFCQKGYQAKHKNLPGLFAFTPRSGVGGERGDRIRLEIIKIQYLMSPPPGPSSSRRALWASGQRPAVDNSPERSDSNPRGYDLRSAAASDPLSRRHWHRFEPLGGGWRPAPWWRRWSRGCNAPPGYPALKPSTGICKVTNSTVGTADEIGLKRAQPRKANVPKVLIVFLFSSYVLYEYIYYVPYRSAVKTKIQYTECSFTVRRHFLRLAAICTQRLLRGS